MIVLVSLIVLLRGFPCFHDFSHGASLHPYSFIFALVPHIFHGSRINAATRMRTCVAHAAPLSRVSLVKWRRCSSHTFSLVPEEVGHDIISHDSHMSTAPRNADSATYSP